MVTSGAAPEPAGAATTSAVATVVPVAAMITAASATP
jgi:hypothetical protein